MANISAILLAAGLSSRMGTNKLLLDFHGQPVIQKVYNAIANTQVDEIIVVVNELTKERIKNILPDNTQLVENKAFRNGMTSSIQAGVGVAKKENALMICLADQPLITSTALNHLMAYFKNAILEDPASIAVPYYQGQKGNPVIFAAYYREALLTHHHAEGCKELIFENKSHLLRVAMSQSGIIEDMDTPEAYERFTGNKL